MLQIVFLEGLAMIVLTLAMTANMGNATNNRMDARVCRTYVNRELKLQCEIEMQIRHLVVVCRGLYMESMAKPVHSADWLTLYGTLSATKVKRLRMFTMERMPAFMKSH